MRIGDAPVGSVVCWTPARKYLIVEKRVDGVKIEWLFNETHKMGHQQWYLYPNAQITLIFFPEFKLEDFL